MPDQPDALVAPRTAESITRAPLRILSLTGGGYRGLFTANVLAELERLIKPVPAMNQSFEVFAGTSIGGLIACALAVGRSATEIAETICRHGPSVFPHKRAAFARRMTFGPIYDSAALRRAIDDCLGTDADTPISEVKVGLAVCAVNWVTGKPEVFRSGALGAVLASHIALRDVCLATSAAPTYFKEHRLNGAPMLDGGLVANNPDALVLFEVLRRWPDRLEAIEMLSIGTAGVDSGGMAGDVPHAGAKWARRSVPLMISAQERLASDQVAQLLRQRYLRINHTPAQGQPSLSELDVVDTSMTATLQALGRGVAGEAFARHKGWLERILKSGLRP